MTIEQIQRHLAEAADDGPAPPTRVTVAEVYRAGMRRRRVRRWCSVAAVGVTAVGVAGGAAVVNASVPAAPLSPGGSVSTARPTPTGRVVTAQPPPRPRTCRQLAAAVTTATESALPGGIRWGVPELPEDTENADCTNGGIVWLTFTYQGRERRLGFEGGDGFADRGCAPARKPVKCEQIAGGEVGHLAGNKEYGVLLSRSDVYFFLGVVDAGPREPLTTDELSKAAQHIAVEVFS
jgi:hypothetical protein